VGTEREQRGWNKVGSLGYSVCSVFGFRFFRFLVLGRPEVRELGGMM